MEGQNQKQSWGAEANPLAVIGLILAFIGAPVGLVLSIIGYRKSRQFGGQGRGLALIGIIVSSLVILVFALMIILAVINSDQINQPDGINIQESFTADTVDESVAVVTKDPLATTEDLTGYIWWYKVQSPESCRFHRSPQPTNRADVPDNGWQTYYGDDQSSLVSFSVNDGYVLAQDCGQWTLSRAALNGILIGRLVLVDYPWIKKIVLCCWQSGVFFSLAKRIMKQPTQDQPASVNPQPQQNNLAIVGFILAFFINIAGLIVSIFALKKAKQLNDHHRGLAIAGIIISSLSILVWTIIVLMVIVGVWWLTPKPTPIVNADQAPQSIQVIDQGLTAKLYFYEPQLPISCQYYRSTRQVNRSDVPSDAWRRFGDKHTHGAISFNIVSNYLLAKNCGDWTLNESIVPSLNP